MLKLAKKSVSTRHLGFLDFTNFYPQFIKGFNKIVIPLISMLKIILSNFFTNTIGSNSTVDPEDGKVAKIDGSVGANIIGKKFKNLLKAKNIKKLAKSKKSDFLKTKANQVFGTGFLILKLN